MSEQHEPKPTPCAGCSNGKVTYAHQETDEKGKPYINYELIDCYRCNGSGWITL